MRRLAVLLLALLAVGVAPARGAVVGLSFQRPATFDDQRFRDLRVPTVRLVTPWDATTGEQEVWLDAALDRGYEPLVAFDHSRGDRCPASPCTLPTVDEFAAAFRRFHARWPGVRLFTAWNEPNHSAQPTAGAPARAAAFYGVVRRECPACTVVAGDLLDGDGMTSYLRTYRDALGEEPAVWGLHDYYDTTYFRADGLDEMLRAVPGDVWLTETGGLVRFSPGGRPGLPFDEGRAASSLEWLFAAVQARPRVGRVYVYQWRADPGDEFDAGLLTPDGGERPGLDVVRRAVAGGSAGPAAASASASASVSAARVPARALVSAAAIGLVRGRLRVPLACAGPPGARCAGRLVLEDARWRTARRVNGRAPADLLRPHDARFSVAAGRATAVRIRLSRAVRRHRRLRVRLTIAQQGVASRTRAATVRLRR